MKINPILDNILLEPIESKSTKSGILLPNTIQDKPSIACVVAVGTSKDEILVNVNDVVIFNKFAGTNFKLDDKEYIIIKQKDILAIID